MLNLSPRLVFAISLIVASVAFILAPIFPLTSPVSSETSAGPRPPAELLIATASSSSSSSSSPLQNSSTDDNMSSIRRAAPLVLPALSRHTATVIFVHGLGDSGRGWADAVQLWQRKRKLDEVKFILPNAPTIPITMNHGFQMPGWFDIKSLGSKYESIDAKAREEDERGILESRDYFNSLIQQEIANGIPANRIVLGGFSQGGAMSIISGLTSPVKLGGIVGLSCWLPLSHKFKDFLPEGDINKATPILMGHGDRDPVVRYDWAQATEKILKDLDHDVTLKTYGGMEHSACLEELDEVESFLVSNLPAQGN